MLKIRLQRGGKTHSPFYRVVLIEKKKYNPHNTQSYPTKNVLTVDKQQEILSNLNSIESLNIPKTLANIEFIPRIDFQNNLQEEPPLFKMKINDFITLALRIQGAGSSPK